MAKIELNNSRIGLLYGNSEKSEINFLDFKDSVELKLKKDISKELDDLNFDSKFNLDEIKKEVETILDQDNRFNKLEELKAKLNKIKDNDLITKDKSIITLYDELGFDSKKNLKDNEDLVNKELDSNSVWQAHKTIKNFISDKKKNFSSTFLKSILEYSKIHHYKVDINLENNLILESIVIFDFFQNDTKESKNQYLLFIFNTNMYNFNDNSINNTLNQKLDNYLKTLESNSDKPWTQRIIRDNIIANYVIEQYSEDDDERAKDILGIKNIIFNDCNKFKSSSTSYYFAKNTMYEAINKIDSHVIFRFAAFVLAFSYKRYFDEQILHIAKETMQFSKELEANDIKKRYSEFLRYLKEMNIFETSHYFKNPIDENSFQAYTIYPIISKGLKLENTYHEFKDNLESMFQTISILEARIRNDERENKEKEEKEKEEKEKKFTSLIGIITGFIAILTFFADGPSILKNSFDIDSTPLITWTVFIGLGIIAVGIFVKFNNLFFWKKNNTN